MRFNGSDWSVVGTPDFSAADVEFTSIAIVNNQPFLAYKDYSNGGKVSAVTFNGSSWVDPGNSSGFTPGSVSNLSLTVSNDGVPYIAFADDTLSNKVTVMKYTGNGWTTVGAAGFSGGSSTFVEIKVDPSGVPYVGYYDASQGDKETVMKYITPPAHNLYYSLNGADNGSVPTDNAAYPEGN